MKVIVAGASGFVGTEILRQAIRHPSITSVVSLTRRPTSLPEDTKSHVNAGRFKSVVCEDFSKYSETAKKELSGADACIWLIAVTPAKLGSMSIEEVRKICVDYTMAGLETLAALPRDAGARPFRFIYTSGAKSERDQQKKPWILAEHVLMRGETETKVLDFAKQSNGVVEACVMKPGKIRGPGQDGFVATLGQLALKTIIGLPTVELQDVAATSLELAVNGFEKGQDTYENDDLTRIGTRALAELE